VAAPRPHGSKAAPERGGRATRETVDFLSSQKMVPLDRYEAYSLASMVADCRVTQVVDIRKGVHCMVPKSVFVKK
jgi:acetamidase/formamidase